MPGGSWGNPHHEATSSLHVRDGFTAMPFVACAFTNFMFRMLSLNIVCGRHNLLRSNVPSLLQHTAIAAAASCVLGGAVVVCSAVISCVLLRSARMWHTQSPCDIGTTGMCVA